MAGDDHVGTKPKEQELCISANNTEKKVFSIKKENRASLLLYGIDLTEDEIQRLETEFQDVLNFRSVTNEDLEDIGIKDPDRRAVLLQRLKSFPEPRTKNEIKEVQPLRGDDSLRILKQNKQHLEVLQSLLLYLKKQRSDAHYVEGGLLDKDWSVEEAIKALTRISITETELLCNRIQTLQDSLQQVSSENTKDLQNKSLIKPYLRWTFGIMIMTAAGIFLSKIYPKRFT